MRYATLGTPAGPLTVLLAGERVVGSGFTALPDDLLRCLPARLRDDRVASTRDLGSVGRAVAEYFDGNLHAIDEVDVEQASGPFIERAWAELRRVAPGAPVSYRELAAASGRPAAVRAAASACARNHVALFVPCHRVVRTSGALGGFRWGLEVKRRLLDHEASGRAPIDHLACGP